MKLPPDDFHRRTYVKLPFSDAYLASGKAHQEAKRDLQKAFYKSLLHVSIRPRPAGRRTSHKPKH